MGLSDHIAEQFFHLLPITEFHLSTESDRPNIMTTQEAMIGFRQNLDRLSKISRIPPISKYYTDTEEALNGITDLIMKGEITAMGSFANFTVTMCQDKSMSFGDIMQLNSYSLSMLSSSQIRLRIIQQIVETFLQNVRERMNANLQIVPEIFISEFHRRLQIYKHDHSAEQIWVHTLPRINTQRQFVQLCYGMFGYIQYEGQPINFS